MIADAVTTAGAGSRSGHGRSVAFPSEAVVIRVLETAVMLSNEERELIRKLNVFRTSVPAGRSFWHDGKAAPRVIISGWACRQRTLRDGRRQIFGFLLPGDTLGLAANRPLDDVSTVALTRVECMDALVLSEILATDSERHRRLKAALRVQRRREEAGMLDQMMRLGCQSALERTAHLFLELRERCQAAGLAEGERFPMPLTQEVLSDALGLSIVHLSRTLKGMRSDGLIEMTRGALAVLDVDRLRRIADFSPPGDYT